MHKIITFLSNIKWWFFHRFHPRHKYNIIKTGLKPGYYDPDTRIIFGIFHIIEQYYDDNTKWGLMDFKEADMLFLKDAALWWKENKNNVYEGYSFDPEEKDLEKLVKMEEKLEEELQVHLHNIITRMRSIWYI